MKTTFGNLWVGDRFTAYGSLWTRLDHRTARQHSERSIQLGPDGGEYVGDTICTFTPEADVVFVPPQAPAAVLAAAGLKMRALQREYFKTRARETLVASKEAEREFDRLLVAAQPQEERP